MSPSIKGKRAASPLVQASRVPNSLPLSPDKRVKYDRPEYKSVREAIDAQHDLYRGFEQIGATSNVPLLLTSAGKGNFKVSVAGKKRFTIVGPIWEHDMNVLLPSVFFSVLSSQ